MPDQRTPLLRNDTRESRRRSSAAAVILLLITLERIAYYSLSSNFYFYLTRTELLWSSDNALDAFFIFSGVGHASCLIGGLVADLWLNKFFTILIGLTLFFASYMALPFTSIDSPKHTLLCHDYKMIKINDTFDWDIGLGGEPCASKILAIVLLAAAGSGLARGNIIVFGAEQVKWRGRTSLQSYFGWMYWCINLGSIIAILGFVYIQEFYNFFLGFILPAALIGVAAIIHMGSYKLFSWEPCTKTFKVIFKIVREAHKSHKQLKASQAQIQDGEEKEVLVRNGIFEWLDMAKARYGGKYHEAAVEDVKAFVTILIVFAFIMPYWMLYYQMQSTFLMQGLKMKSCLTDGLCFPNSTTIGLTSVPAAWFGAFEGIVLLLAIPSVGWFERRYMRTPIFIRILIGMFFAFLAMCCAAGVEYNVSYRYANNQTISCCVDKEESQVADFSILWQIPQYTIMGIGEIFSMVTGMEFAFSQAPTSMQGAIMGLFYFMFGMASFMGLGVLWSFQKISCAGYGMCCNDGNPAGSGDCSMTYYFVFLALFQLIFIVPFYFVSSHLRIRKNFSVGNGSMYASAESRVNLHGSQTNSRS